MEQPTETQYALTAAEKAAMNALNNAAVNAKADIHDLSLQMEKARADLSHAEKRFEGALQLLGIAHGMASVRIAPDLSQIAPA